MEYNKLRIPYEENGLKDYLLRDVKDIKKVYGLDVLKIDGYENLTYEQKELYKKFIVNFFNRWGLEARATIKPQSVGYFEDYNYINTDEDIVGGEVIEIIKGEKGLTVYKWFDDEYKKEDCEIKRTEYISFKYILRDRHEWLHVVDEHTWW